MKKETRQTTTYALTPKEAMEILTKHMGKAVDGKFNELPVTYNFNCDDNGNLESVEATYYQNAEEEC